MTEIISILLEKVLPIFLLVIVGYFYSKIQKLDVKSINKFNMTLPFSAYMFYSTYKMELVISDFFNMTIAILAILIMTYIFVYIILKMLKKHNMRGFYFATLFYNVGFLLPIVELQYGNEGIAKGLCFVFISVVIFFSIGLLLVSIDINSIAQNDKKAKIILQIISSPLKNPILWATVIGVVFNVMFIMLAGVPIFWFIMRVFQRDPEWWYYQ